MTKQDWLESSDLRNMLDYILAVGKASDRKLRLFACACVREAWHLLTDDFSRNAVEVSEKFADGLVGVDDLTVAFRDSICLPKRVEKAAERAAARAATWSATAAAINAAKWTQEALSMDILLQKQIHPEVLANNANILRSIMGNPFCPQSWDPYWSTGSPLTIAEVIYQEKAWSDLPILADALEDAGCTRQDVLDHLRSPGPHHRGDWALDLVLGKE